MLQADQGITPLGTRAYLMNMVPHALNKAFPAYVTLNHGYYAANYYPNVPLDWIAEGNKVLCLITILTWNAFRKPEMLERLQKAPPMQLFGSLKTCKQIEARTAKRYITRSLKTVYEALYPDHKPKNFFLGMVDDRRIYVDFPASEAEYSQVRKLMSNSPMGAFDMQVELREIVMPKKVVHFQPMWNIFMSSDVPKNLSSTPWLALMRRDPFQNSDDLSRNWLCFYRLYNSIAKFSSNFRIVDPVAHHKFMQENRLSPSHFGVEDWRRMDTPLTDEHLMPIVSLVDVSAHR